MRYFTALTFVLLCLFQHTTDAATLSSLDSVLLDGSMTPVASTGLSQPFAGSTFQALGAITIPGPNAELRFTAANSGTTNAFDANRILIQIRNSSSDPWESMILTLGGSKEAIRFSPTFTTLVSNGFQADQRLIDDQNTYFEGPDYFASGTLALTDMWIDLPESDSSFYGFSLSITPFVPEPGSLFIMTAGLWWLAQRTQ